MRMSDFKTDEYANLIGGSEFEPKPPGMPDHGTMPARLLDPAVQLVRQVSSRAS